MSSSISIKVSNVSKTFKVFNSPYERLKQTIFGIRKKYYKEFEALRPLSIAVHRGETFGIVGRNGSGKSTLLQIIAGTLTPSSGEVELKGKVAALLELGSGFNPDYTGRENVYMNGAILGLSRSEIDSLLDDILEFADIGDFIDQPVKTYSSGMVVRLAFAVQVMVPKEILIVDEALAVGDELFQRKCFSKIDEFRNSGGTILFVSHSAGAIVELCDRAMLLDDGECLLVGESKTVVNHYQKLMYAPTERREKIRQQILSLYRMSSQTTMNEGNATIELVSATVHTDPEAAIPSSSLEETFDPGLVPSPTVAYERRGAEIYDAAITNLRGDKVNFLVSGRRYTWQYTVRFDKKCSNVRFGMLINTTSGLELGGAVSSPVGAGIPTVNSGDVLKVEFSFVPRLNPGVYFLNGGVLGLESEGEVFLDRGIDIGAFRIQPPSTLLTTAIIDFETNSEVTLLHSNGEGSSA